MSKFIPRSYDELHPGRFLKAHMLKGEPRTFTVTAYEAEDMAPEGSTKQDLKGILSFKEIREQYATQKTNEALLRAMFGKDPQAVVGKRITLCPATDKFGRETVDAIRIYGSPHLTEQITVKVEYAAKARRPAKTFVLKPVPEAGAAATEGTPDELDRALTAIAEAGNQQELDAVLAELRKKTWGKAGSLAIKAAIDERTGAQKGAAE